MSRSLTRYYDPVRLGRRRALLEGELEYRSLKRFCEALGREPEGAASIRLVFAPGPGGWVEVTGSLSATVTLQCQRCLEPLSVVLDHELHLALADHAGALEQLPEGVEGVEVAERLRPSDLVEDELLTSLPLVAVHTQVAQCGTMQSVLERYTAT